MKNWNVESNAWLLEKIGESIKGRRLQKNISQEELSEMSGVSVASITRLETGKGNTSLTNLLSILKILEIADELRTIFTPPEHSPALLAKAVKGKTLVRVKRSNLSEADKTGEWKWGDDK
jgi:transcriptional regulator with XRE-family HTH domain